MLHKFPYANLGKFSQFYAPQQVNLQQRAKKQDNFHIPLAPKYEKLST